MKDVKQSIMLCFEDDELKIFKTMQSVYRETAISLDFSIVVFGSVIV